ncbi:MAG: hypothetical protein Q8N57_02790 [bacterium]|nr:hypothetical protein [bacterium]
MKKVIILLVVALMANTSMMFGQTKQEKRQMNALNNEIKRTNKEIPILENGLLSDKLASVDRTAILYKIDGKKEKIADLKQERENIFRRYATTVGVPKELSRRGLNRRQRPYTLRREDLVLQKIEANIASSSSASINPSGSSVANSGYKIIVANDYPLPVSFIIRSVNGGDRKTVLLGPSKKADIYLIPGSYLVSFERGGTQYGSDRLLTIDGATHIYNGEECFGFAYMPRF